MNIEDIQVAVAGIAARAEKRQRMRDERGVTIAEQDRDFVLLAALVEELVTHVATTSLVETAHSRQVYIPDETPVPTKPATVPPKKLSKHR